MNDAKEHFDEDLGLSVSSKLAKDLRAICKPAAAVPPEIDRAVLDRARGHFAGREFAKSERRGFRWAGLWRIAAAAAVIILAFSLDLTHKPEPRKSISSVDRIYSVDIDRNGRVDILDAFKLARYVESAGKIEAEWDMNGDGSVDRGDVDLVAFAAVSLPPHKQGPG